MSLTLSRRAEGPHLTVLLGGELDQHSAREAIAYIADAVDTQQPGQLVLDLGTLRFCDSSGLAVVLGAYRRMHEIDGTVALANVPPQPMRVFHAVGLERLIAMEHGKRGEAR